MRLGRRGQATTETVLLLPIFVFFLIAFSKIFALLILVQKIEIASFYAARRWQLESHRNAQYESYDSKVLKDDITDKVKDYLGYNKPGIKKFLQLGDCSGSDKVGIDVERTQVWNVVTLTVCTEPFDSPFYKNDKGFTFHVTKYVPNRDRPIAFVLPGMAN